MDDLIETGLGCLLAAFALVLVGGISLVVVDSLYFERKAFASITECEAKRLEPHRKTLSSDVICISAYRATKNDTLTVNGLVKP